jgi:hypothetical protein
MRERGQASVETVGLIAAVLALAAAVLFGIVRFGPPLATTLGAALSGVVNPGAPTAPGLDGLESALLAAATSPDTDGPTVLDVRTHLRSRLGRAAGDAAFAAALRPLVELALPMDAAHVPGMSFTITDVGAEMAWLRAQFHPGLSVKAAKAVLGLAGPPGAAYSVADSLGLLAHDEPDGIAPGAGAGDVVVRLDSRRTLVLRREPDRGLALIADTVASPREAAR